MVEPDEKPIDLFSSIGRIVQKHSLSFKTVVQPVEVKPQSVEVEP